MLEKFRAEKGADEKQKFLIEKFPKFLSMLEEELVKDNSPMWDVDYVSERSIAVEPSDQVRVTFR